MRIGIIGGGAAGLSAAWLLDQAHEVTLFEAAPICGGHVRTLGGNVEGPDLGCNVDLGVIELERRNFPTVVRLLQALQVRTHPVPGTTSFLRQNGARWYSPGAIAEADAPLAEHVLAFARGIPLFLDHVLFDRAVDRVVPGQTLSSILPDDVAGRWAAHLALYAWSTPIDEVGDLDATMAGPTLAAFAHPDQWLGVEGGIWSWMRAALAQLRGQVRVGAPVTAIHRHADGVEIELPDGARSAYDAVVIAVPPHRILPLLVEADEDERRWYGSFHGRVIETLLHDDDGPYRRRDETYRSEFDCFELDEGRGGYNARLDRLCQAPPERAGIGLAWGMHDEIDPARVLFRQGHEVSAYTAKAMLHRGEVVQAQGHRRTWIAGAWLGDGLHEGAVRSAAEISARLGGRVL